ncbi:hypothetical protein KDAU_58180 [Dictyobacter aurantiacus]|uniref:Uncharacterized protein n=1 Tax=Dictyobacter aurantiacus TaxID=1936993 RepID=A0A401ZNP3_9CHLR|nr:hypothetical protein KDAU_58180 [Dictyobacter aurantiacus]
MPGRMHTKKSAQRMRDQGKGVERFVEGLIKCKNYACRGLSSICYTEPPCKKNAVQKKRTVVISAHPPQM